MLLITGQVSFLKFVTKAGVEVPGRFRRHQVIKFSLSFFFQNKTHFHCFKMNLAVASDRFAIQTKGKETVELAPQHLLSCVRKQSGCQGGHLDWAWNYIRKIG